MTALLDRAPRWRAGTELARGRMKPAAWKLRRRFAHRTDEKCLCALGIELAQAEIDTLLAELREAPELAAALRRPAAGSFWGASVPTLDEQLALSGAGRARALFLYVAVRARRPTTVVETGCYSGWDSAVILTALERNGHGSLLTIDLPPQRLPLGHQMPPLPESLEPGALVVDELRGRWDLRLADVRAELPRALAEVGELDLFFHDSDHSYSNTIWELSSAWSRLSPSGWLVVDDVSWNTAAWDFARGIGVPVSMRRGAANVAALSPAGAA